MSGNSIGPPPPPPLSGPPSMGGPRYGDVWGPQSSAASMSLGPSPLPGPRYGDVWGPQSSPAPGGVPAQATEATAASSGGSALESAGVALAIGGALMQTVGAFYAAKTAKYESKAAAMTLDFQSRMSMLNARAAEEHAQAILKSSRREIGALSMRYGRERGRAQAQLGARGGQAGVGSAAESMVGIDYESKLAQFTVSANAVRAAASARMGAQNQRTEASFQALSSRNAARSGQSIRSEMGAFTVAVGNAATIIRTRTRPRDYQ